LALSAVDTLALAEPPFPPGPPGEPGFPAVPTVPVVPALPVLVSVPAKLQVPNAAEMAKASAAR
jgi:hypothetical protein